MDKIEMTKTYPVDIKKVWDAWTTEEVGKWIGPGDTKTTVHSMDVTEGGTYSMTFNTPKGDHKLSGTYKEISPMNKLVFTWAWEGSEEPETIVTVMLKEQDGSTEMTMIHEGFTTDEQVKNHTEGWGGSFANLENTL